MNSNAIVTIQKCFDVCINFIANLIYLNMFLTYFEMGYSSKKGFNRLKDVYELSKTMQDALLQKHKIQKFS